MTQCLRRIRCATLEDRRWLAHYVDDNNGDPDESNWVFYGSKGLEESVEPGSFYRDENGVLRGRHDFVGHFTNYQCIQPMSFFRPADGPLQLQGMHPYTDPDGGERRIIGRMFREPPTNSGEVINSLASFTIIKPRGRCTNDGVDAPTFHGMWIRFSGAGARAGWLQITEWFGIPGTEFVRVKFHRTLSSFERPQPGSRFTTHYSKRSKLRSRRGFRRRGVLAIDEENQFIPKQADTINGASRFFWSSLQFRWPDTWLWEAPSNPSADPDEGYDPSSAELPRYISPTFAQTLLIPQDWFNAGLEGKLFFCDLVQNNGVGAARWVHRSGLTADDFLNRREEAVNSFGFLIGRNENVDPPLNYWMYGFGIEIQQVGHQIDPQPPWWESVMALESATLGIKASRGESTDPQFQQAARFDDPEGFFNGSGIDPAYIHMLVSLRSRHWVEHPVDGDTDSNAVTLILREEQSSPLNEDVIQYRNECSMSIGQIGADHTTLPSTRSTLKAFGGAVY